MLIRRGCLIGSILIGSLFGATLRAAEPSPENIIHTASPQEAAARDVVLAWSKMLGSGQVKEAFEKYVSKDFVEHSHLVRSIAKTDRPGYAETLAFFNREASGKGPGADAPKPAPSGAAPAPGVAGLQNLQIAVVNDDIVTQYGGLGVDIFRVKDGKITDHWDASPPRNVKITISDSAAAAPK